MKGVALFVPCLVDQFLPEIGIATAKVLKKLGTEVYYDPRQTCCGQPLFNAGDIKGASKVAKHFISVFEKSEYIVAPSGSCIHMVKEHYPSLFKDDPAWKKRACAVADKVYEFTQFIVSVLKVEDINASYKAKACLHESCSITSQMGISIEPKALLKNVKGLEIVALNNADTCCGFGGEFSADYPDISGAILKDKVDNFVASGADTLILGEPGCLLNIRGYMRKNAIKGQVKHIAEILAGEGA
jgi:L-lactate dehydrogenase complex protein LldE